VSPQCQALAPGAPSTHGRQLLQQQEQQQHAASMSGAWQAQPALALGGSWVWCSPHAHVAAGGEGNAGAVHPLHPCRLLRQTTSSLVLTQCVYMVDVSQGVCVWLRSCAHQGPAMQCVTGRGIVAVPDKLPLFPA
jgi:hypothetical protein